MAKVILAVNAGSSSVKCSLFRADDGEAKRLALAEVSGLNGDPSFKYKRGDKTNNPKIDSNLTSHDEAFKLILQQMLNDNDLKEVNAREDIDHVTHRVVHGGDYQHEVLITEDTFHHIAALEDLAPLHNASAGAIMQTCMRELPRSRNVAFFDSSFHATMPDAVKTYAIDQKVACEKGLRKYGFHGISYASILRSVSGFLGRSESQINLIVLHLGSGASACAIKQGRSVDTTMGLTPVSGLPGSTRSGDVDPSLVFHYTSGVSKLSPKSTRDIHITRAEEILNKECGWKALTGTTDFSKIGTTGATGAEKLALDIFVDRIIGYIGSFYVKIGGKVDALVFAGGIGEKSALLRARVVQDCACLGFEIDSAKNDHVGDDQVVDISAGLKSRVLVCQTDEEGEMARICIEQPK